MELCNDCEIVFESRTYRNCPLCEIKDKLKDAEDALDELEKGIDALKDEISELKSVQ